WLGVALIVTSYFLISKDNLWPGYLAIFPVLGSFLIIQAQRNDSLITSNTIFQKLGVWSYSIYLWHWPFVVGIYFYSLSDIFIYLGIILSILLGFISNKYIEKVKFSHDFSTLFSYLKCKPVYMVLNVGLIGGFIFVSDGVLNRFSDDLQIKYKNAIIAIGDWNYPNPNLKVRNIDVRFIKGNSDKNILFIGASHIEQTYPYVESFSSEYNVYYVTKGGCLVTPSYVHPQYSCSNIQSYKEIINEVVFDKIVTSIYGLDFNLSENDYVKAEQVEVRIDEYNDFLRFAKSKTREVFMILGEPTDSNFDPTLSVRYDLKNYITIKEARELYTLHYSALKKLDEMDGIILIDPIDYLCDEVCMVMDNDLNYYYKDSSHMRPWYAEKSLQYLDNILK
ncbi:MAG: acyltransferase family protein, partial [Cellulophaga fucicola]